MTNEERRNKRATSLAAMGLVERDGDHFKVLSPSLRGNQTSNTVKRDKSGAIVCSCLEFEAEVANSPAFRCEHILAVKYALVAKNFSVAGKS